MSSIVTHLQKLFCFNFPKKSKTICLFAFSPALLFYFLFVVLPVSLSPSVVQRIVFSDYDPYIIRIVSILSICYCD